MTRYGRVLEEHENDSLKDVLIIKWRV